MSIEIFKEHLSGNKFDSLYLFYGPEEFLKKKYLDNMVDLSIEKGTEALNKIVFKGEIDTGKLIEACRTMPFFSERKMVIVKNSGFFKNKSGNYEDLISFFSVIPSHTILVFVEDEIDARLKITKAIKEKGLMVELEYQKADELAKWVMKGFKTFNKEIDYKTASLLVEYCEPGMTGIYNEIEKITAYMGEEKKVQARHIKDVVTKSIKAIIFDLLDAIFEKKSEKAMVLFRDMLNLREPVPRILVMVAWQLRMVLELKACQQKGIPLPKAAARLKIAPFVLKKLTRQIENYDIDTLKKAMEDCHKLDLGIKTGQIDPQTGMEMLILKYAAS